MKLFIATIIILHFLCGIGYCILPSPPVLQNDTANLNQFLKSLYDEHNKLSIVTTNPNGNRYGTYGDIAIWLNAGAYKLYTCVSSPSGQSWQIVQTGTTATINWGDIGGTLSNQTDLQSKLDAKVDKTTHIDTTSPLTGGGDLTVGRNLGIQQAGAVQDGYLSSTDFVTFSGKQDRTYNISFVHGNYSIVATDDVVRCDVTATITLPVATGSGRWRHIKNVGAGTVTLSGNSIDGEGTQAISASNSVMVVDVGTDLYDII